jgi:hypothetical protein
MSGHGKAFCSRRRGGRKGNAGIWSITGRLFARGGARAQRECRGTWNTTGTLFARGGAEGAKRMQRDMEYRNTTGMLFARGGADGAKGMQGHGAQRECLSLAEARRIVIPK